jgi:hypothetical protein
MGSQFLALIRRKPIFRVVEGETTRPLIRPTPTVNFDMTTFISEVRVGVVERRARVGIEVAFQEGGGEWSAISGFPCVLEVSLGKGREESERGTG